MSGSVAAVPPAAACSRSIWARCASRARRPGEKSHAATRHREDPRVRAYCIHTSRRGSPSPACWGRGAERRMGCGPLLRRKSDCTTVTVNLHRSRPVFRTPSGLRPPSPLRGEGEPADREQLNENHREFDLRECDSVRARGDVAIQSRATAFLRIARCARDDDSSGGSVVAFAALDDLTAKRSRREMAPQELEKIESAPGNGLAFEISTTKSGMLASLAMRALTASAALARAGTRLASPPEGQFLHRARLSP